MLLCLEFKTSCTDIIHIVVKKFIKKSLSLTPKDNYLIARNTSQELILLEEHGQQMSII